MRLNENLERALKWWVTLALAAVIFKTAQQIGSKALLERYQDTVVILLVAEGLIVVLWTPFVLATVLRMRRALRPLCSRPGAAVTGLLIWLVTDITASVMFAEALRTGELSVVGPLRHTGTLFSFFIGYLWLKQQDAWQRKLIGSVVVIAGALLIQGSQFALDDSVPVFLAVGAAAIWAVQGSFENRGIHPAQGIGMPPSVFGYLALLGLTMAYGAWVYATRRTFAEAWPVVWYTLTDWRLALSVIVAGALSMWLGLAAFVTGDVVGVSAIRRAGVITTMFSGWMFFGEDISSKIVGGLVLFAGVMLVALPNRSSEKK